jgi:hypothetical protein
VPPSGNHQQDNPPGQHVPTLIAHRVVSFAGQDPFERATIDKYGWLDPGELEDGTERPADPEIPRLMRAAIAAVRGQGLS